MNDSSHSPRRWTTGTVAHEVLRRLCLPALAVAATTTALLAGGCASSAGIGTEGQKLDEAALVGGGAPAPEIPAAWWKTYGDAGLDGLIDKALRDSPTLAAAQARLRQAQSATEAAGAYERPRVDGSFDATRQRYTENGLIPRPLAGTTQTTGALQASGSWEIDLFGRQRASLNAAIGAQRAADADLQASRVLLATNVVRQYVVLARGIERQALLQRSLAQREETLALIRQRVKAGIDTEVELHQGEGALPEMRQQIEAVDEQNRHTRHALAALTGQAPNALDTLSPKLSAVQLVPLPASIPADLLGRRADIAAARWRIEAATEGMQAAKAQFYPSINLLGFVGYSSLGLDKLVDAGSRQYGVGPALRLPIFDAGRLRANLRGKAADADLALAAYNGAVLDALREVADALASLQSLERQQKEQSAAQASAESAYDLAKQRYRAGLGTYLTVLSAETNVLAQRRASVDLKARVLDAQVQLVRGLGGGYAPAAQVASR